MDNLERKRPVKPTNPCQYGKGCYQKNPEHLMKYSHAHLEKILRKNPSGEIDEQNIPSDLLAHKESVLCQLNKMKILYSNDALEPVNKKLKPSTREEISENAKNAAEKRRQGNSSNAEPIVIDLELDNVNHRQHAINIPPPKRTVAQKLAAAHPYNLFLTAIKSSPRTHSETLTITFRELMDDSLGELECSVQINFMVSLDWLMQNYKAAGHIDKPLIIIHGSDAPELKTVNKVYKNVTAHKVYMGSHFATHHTKMMLFGYRDKSMRVVVSTGNLIRGDWKNITQGVWISPRLEPLPDGEDVSNGESPTEFRSDLLKYLRSYNLPKLQNWLIRIRKTNFKPVNVFLITSIPGTFLEGSNGYTHGHGRVNWLLSNYSAPIEDSVPLVAQCSSIGSLGKDANEWLLKEFLDSFSRDSQSSISKQIPPFQLIYPSFNNVIGSHDSLLGAGGLPYGSKTHGKQEWLSAYMYQWKATGRFRSQAMPHIKTYARWTNKKMHWFMMTSANLSKAAWGSYNKAGKNGLPLRVNNYEAGVMFLPKFVTGTDYFSLDPKDTATPTFPALYDMPLLKYATNDVPYLSDVLYGI